MRPRSFGSFPWNWSVSPAPASSIEQVGGILQSGRSVLWKTCRVLHRTECQNSNRKSHGLRGLGLQGEEGSGIRRACVKLWDQSTGLREVTFSPLTFLPHILNWKQLELSEQRKTMFGLCSPSLQFHNSTSAAIWRKNAETSRNWWVGDI